MKIVLIQQAETDMPWQARYDAAGFERAIAEEAAEAQAAADRAATTAWELSLREQNIVKSMRGT